MRHWLVYPDEPWRHSPPGPTVVATEPARRHGYRVEGPFALEADVEAVGALRELVEFVESIDGKADDFGELKIVARAKVILAAHGGR